MRKVTKSLVRIAAPDRKFDNRVVGKLINRVMLNGKKTVAEGIVYDAMELASKSLKNDNQLEILETALANVRPNMETRSRRVGGANFQIPFPVSGQRQQHLTLMWFIEGARKRKGIPMAKRLSLEIIDAYNNTGFAVKKKEDVHKMAESNRAFAHFARGKG
jgi:small subunit ribosomal protein S7